MGHAHLLLVGSSADQDKWVHPTHPARRGYILLAQLEDELDSRKGHVLAQDERFLHFGF